MRAEDENGEAAHNCQSFATLKLPASIWVIGNGAHKDTDIG